VMDRAQGGGASDVRDHVRKRTVGDSEGRQNLHETLVWAQRGRRAGAARTRSGRAEVGEERGRRAALADVATDDRCPGRQSEYRHKDRSCEQRQAADVERQWGAAEGASRTTGVGRSRSGPAEKPDQGADRNGGGGGGVGGMCEAERRTNGIGTQKQPEGGQSATPENITGQMPQIHADVANRDKQQ
jgi:hypothetical protein